MHVVVIATAATTRSPNMAQVQRLIQTAGCNADVGQVSGLLTRASVAESAYFEYLQT